MLIYDIFKLVTTTFKPSTQSGTKYDQQLLRLTDNKLDSLHTMQIEKSEDLKYVLQFGDCKCYQRHLEHKSRIYITRRNRDQTCKKSSEERESESESKKANKMPKTTQREAIAYVGSQKATVHLEIHGQSSITQKREAKGRDDLVRTFFSVSRT